MTRLSTVNPNRLGVVYRDGKSGEVSSAITNGFAREEKVRPKRSRPRRDNSQSRFEATDQRLARVVEGGLSGGVVFLTELKGDSVSRLGGDVSGVEQETTRAADDNTVVPTSRRSRGRRRIHDRGGGGSG